MILGIDPGNEYTAFCLIDEENGCKPVLFGKKQNWDVHYLLNGKDLEADHVAIEMIASYGMPVGAEVFETCVWIGRFAQVIEDNFDTEGIEKNGVEYVFRKDEKIAICKSMKANDATIKQALIDMFAKGQKNYGKGTKNDPGFFYGFKADVWSAFAVAVTYHLMHGGNV